MQLHASLESYFCFNDWNHWNNLNDSTIEIKFKIIMKQWLAKECDDECSIYLKTMTTYDHFLFFKLKKIK